MVTQNTISLLPHIYCWYHVVAKVHLRWKPEENKRALNFMLFCFTAAILDYIILVCINRGYHCQIFDFRFCMRSVFFYWISKYIYWLNWKEKLWNFGFSRPWTCWKDGKCDDDTHLKIRSETWFAYKGSNLCLFWISDKFVVSPTSLQRFWLN